MMVTAMRLLAGTLVVVLGLYPPVPAQAESLQAEAMAGWGFDYDIQQVTGANLDWNARGAHWSLGYNSATVEGNHDVHTGHIGGYGSTPVNKFAVAEVHLFPGDFGPYAMGFSTVSVGSGLTANGLPGLVVAYPYTLGVAAEAHPHGYRVNYTRAEATAADPQPLYPALITTTLTLGVGSAVYAAGGDEASATTSIAYASSLMADPILTILLENVGGTREADVTFGSDADLSFTDPGTGTAMTAADLELLLEANEALWSGSVLLTEMDLVSFTYDLTGWTQAELDSHWFSSVARATAEVDMGASSPPVPEPASLALFGIGAAGLALHRRRRRHTA